MVGGVHGRGHVWWGVSMAGGGMCDKEHAWMGACMAGGMHGRGAGVAGGMHGREVCMVGGMCGRGACMAHMPTLQILRDTVNKWAVRILLECILVSKSF